MKHALASLIISIFATSLVLSSSAANAQEKPLTEAQVEEIVKKVIKENPDLIVKSVEMYQMKEQADSLSKAAKNVVAMQGDLQNNPNSPSIGNPNADVTIVEFFDYHCGYCKRFFPVLTQLLDSDHNLRLVFKEFPILAEDSALAAKAALAVNHIDKNKYLPFHTVLMKSSMGFTMENLTAKAKEIGIDPEDFKKAMQNPDLDKEISHNKDIAQQLNIAGTPAVIIGNEVIPGAITLDVLKEKVAAARATK